MNEVKNTLKPARCFSLKTLQHYSITEGYFDAVGSKEMTGKCLIFLDVCQ